MRHVRQPSPVTVATVHGVIPPFSDGNLELLSLDHAGIHYAYAWTASVGTSLH
jgi:hypothetical protein